MRQLAMSLIENQLIQMWVVVLTFLLVTFFDTAGTLVGLANQAGFMKDNKMPRVGKALAADVTTANKGENSKLKINKIPVVIAVIPERPPTAIPADDSTLQHQR
jgi:hypothetical protein